MLTANTYVNIDLDAISENFDAICQKSGKAVMAVVKANGYGHGAVPIARLLEKRSDFFGVATIAEALELRQAGIRKPILILGYVNSNAYPQAISEEIRLTIYRLEDALALSETAQRLNKTALCHLAVDTGMSRIGFAPTEESADLCARIATLPGLKIEGLFSHYATADCLDLNRTYQQAELFSRFDSLLKERNVYVPIRHLDNSAGLMHFGCEFEMVRAGIILYGMYPSDEIDPKLLPLRPALSWLSCISHIKLLPPGSEIGYGGTFVTTRPTMVATVPVGYADGYRRNLSNRFYVLIRGKKAPILGRICMDQMMVDVTDIPGARHGDEVTLIGQNGDEIITTEQIAAMADSFHYEFPCGIHHRVPRIYYRNGSMVDQLHYLP